MRGDALASGARSASFPQGKTDATERPAAGMKSVEIEKPREVWGECRDCDGKFYSAAEFVNHECKGKRP